MNQRQQGIARIFDKVNERVYSQFVYKMNAEISVSSKRFTIAVVLICPHDESKFLVVKRPSNDECLPNVWGLPAITLFHSELPEKATSRLGQEKLNTQIKFLGCLNFDAIDRGQYELILMDVVAELIGVEPSVTDALTKHTKYTQQQWTDDLFLLKEAALKGSLCSQILLGAFSSSSLYR